MDINSGSEELNGGNKNSDFGREFFMRVYVGSSVFHSGHRLQVVCPSS